jgi:hypothetical protein
MVLVGLAVAAEEAVPAVLGEDPQPALAVLGGDEQL